MTDAATASGSRVLLLDVNVLLALLSPNHVHHLPARRWLQHAAHETGWATTPVTEWALVRLLLNPTVMGDQLEPALVLALVRDLRRRPGHTFLTDDGSPCEPVVDLRSLTGHGQVADFHLIDLARRQGAVLATFDRALTTYLAPGDRELVTLVPA